MRITSTQNPAVRFVRSLDRATVRRENGVFLVEGVRLVTEAVDTGQIATLALYDPDMLARSAAGSSLLRRVPLWAETSQEVSPHVLRAAAQTEAPAGIVAVVRLPPLLDLTSCARAPFGVVLDRLADPGNVGTILRTADALGVSYVVTLPGSVDLFAPKVVRAAMGAHFRLPLIQHPEWVEIASALDGAEIVAAAARQGIPLPSFDWPDRAAFVVGSEAHGLSEEIEAAVSTRVHIPMREGVESLNAAVAACITMYAALGKSLLRAE